jgi:isopenicillin-N N-acyltransferase-like protein
MQVAHVWGTAYDMGYAQGELMRDEARAFVPQIYQYLVEQILNKAANDTALAFIVKEGVEIALDISYERTKDALQP